MECKGERVPIGANFMSAMLIQQLAQHLQQAQCHTQQHGPASITIYGKMVEH
jgi:hypothetical protein